MRLRHGDEEALLFLRPGDALVLHVDAARFATTLRYTGAGAAANAYLARVARQFPEPPGELPEETLRFLSPPRYRRLVDAYRSRRLRDWTAYTSAHPALPNDFRAYVRRGIACEWGTALLGYAVPAAGPPRYPASGAPDTAFRFLQQLRLPAPPAALRERSCLGFLASYAVACLRPPADTARWSPPLTGAQVRQLYGAAGQVFGPGRFRDVVMGLVLYRQLLTGDAGAFAPQWAVFRAENRDSVVARGLRQQYRQRRPLAAGQPAPSFALRDSTGRVVRLADLRGKVVYLEFWASWCAPCLAEFPALEPLKRHFVHQEVVFAYVSIDENPRAWRAALRRYPALGGAASVHLLDGGFTTPTVQAYQLAGVPAYWVIGRDGRIFYGNAPRPSARKATINLLTKIGGGPVRQFTQRAPGRVTKGSFIS